jgi:hypothetical protein
VHRARKIDGSVLPNRTPPPATPVDRRSAEGLRPLAPGERNLATPCRVRTQLIPDPNTARCPHHEHGHECTCARQWLAHLQRALRRMRQAAQRGPAHYDLKRHVALVAAHADAVARLSALRRIGHGTSKSTTKNQYAITCRTAQQCRHRAC